LEKTPCRRRRAQAGKIQRRRSPEACRLARHDFSGAKSMKEQPPLLAMGSGGLKILRAFFITSSASNKARPAIITRV